jgi:hypothetical protein
MLAKSNKVGSDLGMEEVASLEGTSIAFDVPNVVNPPDVSFSSLHLPI